MKQKYKAILCIIASAFCFAVMNNFVHLAGDLPTFEKAFFRNFVAMFVAAGALLKNHASFRPQKGCLPELFGRAVFGTIGLLCNFYAVDHLVVADASMLNKMSPFFAIIFSFFLLKEKLTVPQGAAVVAAFCGSMLIVKPTLSNMDLVPSLIGLLGGMGAGLAYTLVRRLGQKGERGDYIVFFFSAFSVVVVTPLMLLTWEPMTWQQLLCLLGAGLTAAGGQFGITKAYCYAPAREISVYDYTQVIFAALIAWFLFDQVPDAYSILGYVIICTVAVVMFLYNNRKPKTA
ncbi:MAG: DMT family transporter [Oscillospiraceae bacterium]|nr:DMT family transporter [Oscillospiraceae bacterium]